MKADRTTKAPQFIPANQPQTPHPSTSRQSFQQKLQKAGPDTGYGLLMDEREEICFVRSMN